MATIVQDGGEQQNGLPPSCSAGSCPVAAGGTGAGAGESGRTFAVRGLDCAEEVTALKRELAPLVGGEERLSFDLLNGRMAVDAGPGQLSDAEIKAAVARAGMTAERWRGTDSGSASGDDRQRKVQLVLTVLSGLSVLAGILLHASLASGPAAMSSVLAGEQGLPLPTRLAYGLAIAFGARFVVVKAWHALRRLRADMNLLMVIAVAGALAIGQWFEAATVTFLFALSLTLESWSVGRARRAIAALLDLAPSSARILLPGGGERGVAAAEVAIGTRIVVRPGERLPLDGRVVAGASAVNQAPITGESLPVAKQPGTEVFAGTINGDGALEVVSTRRAADTTLSRIIRLVEQAQGRRARVEQWVERFARAYTPAVIGLAIAVFVIPPLAFDAPWQDWFYRALVLLVIACPCALVISTPVSIVAALAAAARQGVLVKGGTYLEQPAHLRAIAIDKTGTLTRGSPEVVALIPLAGHSESELLERAAALELRSHHPLAEAIVAYAERRGIAAEPAEAVHVLPGKGVSGRFHGEAFWLGSHRFLLEHGDESVEAAAQAGALARQGRTVVAIGNARHVCGLIAVADTLRAGAREALAALRAAGVEQLVMLTGDNRATAEAIAAAAGIDAVEAELLPEDKVAAVEKLVARYGTVAMVGDGVNDAPAMARASLGIAMGAIGSDAAIETADIALMTDDLGKLPWLIHHSRRTLTVIRHNIAFALAVKALFVALTFAGFATLWGAIAADAGASLLVVANALRLLAPAPPPRPPLADARPPRPACNQ